MYSPVRQLHNLLAELEQLQRHTIACRGRSYPAIAGTAASTCFIRRQPSPSERRGSVRDVLSEIVVNTIPAVAPPPEFWDSCLDDIHRQRARYLAMLPEAERWQQERERNYLTGQLELSFIIGGSYGGNEASQHGG